MTDLGEPAVRSGRRPRLFAAGAALVVLAGVLGQTAPGGYVAWRWAFEHPAYECLAGGALGFGAAALTRTNRWWTTTLKALVVVPSVLALIVGLFWVPGQFLFDPDWHLTLRAAAPADAPYELRVYSGSDLIDSVWRVSVRNGTGPTAREWWIGCLPQDGDEGYGGDAYWVDARHVRVELGSGPRTFRVDENGHPHGHVGTFDGC